MQKAFPLPVMEFLLPEEVPTASEESSYYQKKRDATAEKVALLLKSSSNCQSKSYDSYAKLEVIEFGDSYEAPGDVATTGSASDETSKKKGRTVTLNTDDMQKRKNDVKARTTLLLSFPDEHQLRFSKVVWDWSYMANDDENHALVADEETPTEFALMAKTSAESKVFDNSLCSKAWLAQVEARLAEHRNQELKYYKKIRVLEFKTESKENYIKSLTMDLELLKKEKGESETKLTGFQTASKDLDSLFESQRLDKNKEGLGYSAVPPPPAQKVPQMMRKPSVTVTEASPSTITPKTFIKFVKATDRSIETKTAKVETAKPAVKYDAMYIKPSKVLSSQNNIDDKGYWDSGCSRHMTRNISYLSDYEPFDEMYVSFGQDGCKITSKGTIKTGKLEFENVYFVKDLKYNLFSVSQICDNKNSVMFTDLECIVLRRDFKLIDDTNVLLRTPRQHNMYSINLNNIVPHKDLTCLVAKASADEGILWNMRLGHLNFKIMNRLVRHNLVRGLPSKCFKNDHTCTACLKGKHHKASCKSKLVNSVTKPLHTLHMDLFGPTSDKTSGILRKFITEIENLKDLKVKIIRTPQQNGVVERRNRTLIEAAKTMLADAKLPITFWEEEFEEKWDEGYFIGYPMSSKAFRVFNKITKRVEENLHVDFLENKAIEKGTNSTNFSGTKDPARQEVKKDVSSLRYIALPNWIHEVHLESSSSQPQETCNSDEPESSGNFNPSATSTNPSADQLETLTVETPIPTVSSPVLTACLNDSPEPSSDTRLISKRVANQVETPSLDNILTLTNRFEDILRVKTNSDESNGVEADVSNMETTITTSPTPTLKIYKDHPQSQIIGPVDTPIQTRLFLAYASFMGFTVYQMDVKSSFLYGTIDEEVYVMQPPRFKDPEFPAKVYKVEKAMYGLHQAPRAWYGTLSKYLLTNGFQRGTIDQTLFIRRQRGNFILVQVYVDDIIFGSSNPQLCREFEALIHEKFQMSAIGELNFFLGLQAPQKEDVIFLSQDKYGKDGTGKDVDLHLYRSMIGSLMYLTTSRPDIMFAICACARHQVTPKECHLHAVKRIFRYLKGHPKLGLRKLISWQCKKQTIMATSTTEAEYVAAASSCRQVLWIQNQLLDYGLSIPYEALSKEISSSMLRLIETTKDGTKILATVDGKLRTVSESSIRRNLKLNDEAGISSLPDAELFENLQLMGYNILPNQKFTFQKGQFFRQWKYLIHTIMQCLSPKSTGFNEFSSNIGTGLVCLATNRVYNFSKMIFDGMVKNVNNKVSKFLMYPRFLSICLRMSQFGQITHTHTYVVPFHTQKLFTTLRVNSPSFSSRIVPLFDTMLVPQGEGSGTPTEPHHTPSPEAQQTSPTTSSSPTLPPVTTANIPPVIPTASLPTVVPFDNPPSGNIPGELGLLNQDRANIAKTSTLPSDSVPRVTSLAADEGSVQQKLDELTALCTSLQRQHSEMVSRFKAQELEINNLKARIKLLEDKDRGVADQSRDDAPIKRRRLDKGEEAAERVSNETEEMINVLTSMDAATILSSGIAEVPTGSGFIPTVGPPATRVPTGSDVVPTVGPIFATATVVTPYTRRKGKEKMIESKTPKKKKIQEQMDIQMARQIEEEMEREAQRMNEQIARDANITRIHAEEELQIMIDGLDRKLPIERRIELISDLVRYQDNYAKVHKYQSQQRKPLTKKQQREFCTLVLRNQEEAERFKRKGIRFEQESVKKLKTSKEVKATEEVLEEKLKEMMQLGRIVGNKMHKAFSLPVMEFPLLEEVPTASEESSYCQKKRDATAEKVTLLLKSSSNCQSKSYDSYAKLVPHV
nr:hypothetical protein [Tanacetum cinerariifolium]